jgi:aminopeptidase N
VIPVAYGLLSADGREMAAGTLTLEAAEDRFAFDLPERPVPSLLRGFSAPVILQRAGAERDWPFLLAHDPDPFNRWEAGRSLALEVIVRMIDGAAEAEPAFLDGMAAVARRSAEDPAFAALALSLPSEDEIIGHLAEAGRVPDPLAVHQAGRGLDRQIAEALGGELVRLYEANAVPGPYSPDAAAAGRRALRGRALGLLTRREPEAERAEAQFAASDNMTERMAALTVLVANGRGEAALDTFHAAWRHDPIVLDKWFAVQASHTPPFAAAGTVEALARHPDFDWRNPNRLRSLVGVFAMANPAGFHAVDGRGYRFVIDWLIRVDPGQPADRGAARRRARRLAALRRGAAGADARPARAAGGAAEPVARHRRDRRAALRDA